MLFDLKATKPNTGPIRQLGRNLDMFQQRAAALAVDKATRLGHKRTQLAMIAAGLGKLNKAVGWTSSFQKGQRTGRNPWGAIYAKGQARDDDRGAGALEAYSEGATITPGNDMFGTGWLWIATPAVPKRDGRGYRMTPALYNRSAHAGTIGKLIFKQISSNRAILVIRNVTVSPKTGRAKAAGPGKTRTRIPMREVVAFVGIKVTRRMKRFDQRQIARLASMLVTGFAEQELNAMLSRAG